MLEGLDAIVWEDLDNNDNSTYFAYDSPLKISVYIGQLLSSDSQERSYALRRLYENCLHQGTQFEGTPYVLPFIIELCGEPSIPNRFSLLRFWSHAITGYFSIQERPTWETARIFIGTVKFIKMLWNMVIINTYMKYIENL